jgi:ribosomal protein S12 methylthiotransferase
MQSYAAIVTLGCAKNLVDSETLAPQITRCGYRLTDNPELASLILINTCGFLQSAVEEAIQTILELATFKVGGSCHTLIVAGCMVQRYGKKLLSLLPEVDLFLGTSHYLSLESILNSQSGEPAGKLWISRPTTLMTSQTPRFRSTAAHTAFVKIADGCSNHCAFCKIPQLRGPYRSRTVEDVLLEVRRLVSEGAKEINLVAQDTTAFGSDRGEDRALLRLLEFLDETPGLEWVRLLYAYPERIESSLLQTIAQSRKIVRYLDIPLQHSAPKILQLMRRGKHVAVQDLVERIRSVIPDISLRTSLMVGFPGETEADFDSLLHFVEDTQFDHLGVFSFSPEEGVRAAKLPMRVCEDTKEERRRVLLETQRNISRRRLQGLVGNVLPVMLEGHHPETELLLIGRLATQAPEVDGSVIITRGTGQAGEILTAKIERAHDYDVEAELVSPC